MDVVAVMHLGQVVEAAGLHIQAAVLSVHSSKRRHTCASWSMRLENGKHGISKLPKV